MYPSKWLKNQSIFTCSVVLHAMWLLINRYKQTLVDDCGKSEQAGISGYVVL